MKENHLVRSIFMILPLVDLFLIRSKLFRYTILISMWAYISNDYLVAIISSCLSLYRWIADKVYPRFFLRKQ